MINRQQLVFGNVWLLHTFRTVTAVCKTCLWQKSAHGEDREAVARDHALRHIACPGSDAA